MFGKSGTFGSWFNIGDPLCAGASFYATDRLTPRCFRIPDMRL